MKRVLNTPGATAGSLIVLDVRRAGPLFDTGAAHVGTYRRIQLYRGPAGTVVAAGGPVCTVLGEGRTAAEAREVAETRALTLLSRLHRHAQRAV